MYGFERAEREFERARDNAGCTCEPTIIRAEKAYEPDGYSMEYTYNCEECDFDECEYWKEYNDADIDMEEYQREQLEYLEWDLSNHGG